MPIARSLLAVICGSMFLVGPASAQLPVATGRQLSLSNSAWKVFLPSTFYTRPGNVSDVLVHFHGDPQTVYNNAKYANLNAAIITVNYSGLSSAYSTPFSNAALFQTLLNEARQKVSAEADVPDTLQWDKLAVSSFSAGYGAVREILKSATYRNEIDALLAADSLYATTAGDGTPLDSQMVDYKTFATLAKNGSKSFIYTHSQVVTPYESTRECGDELMQHLGISASAVSSNGLGTLNFYRHAKSGKFELWGASGADGDSHLEHLRYIGEFLEDLPLAKLLPGDFNADGSVDTADYVVWRNRIGVGNLPNDNGVSPGVIDAADYNLWRSRFGSKASAGSGSAGDGPFVATVPEPMAVSSALVLAVLLVCARRRQ